MKTRTNVTWRHHVWIRQIDRAESQDQGKYYITAIEQRRGIVFLHRDGKWKAVTPRNDKGPTGIYDDPVQAEEMLRAVGYPEEPPETSSARRSIIELSAKTLRLEKVASDLVKLARSLIAEHKK